MTSSWMNEKSVKRKVDERDTLANVFLNKKLKEKVAEEKREPAQEVRKRIKTKNYSEEKKK